ncbi:MAG: response regulator [Sedimenticola sp.]
MSGDLQHRLRQLREHFAEQLPEKFSVIEASWREYAEKEFPVETARELQNLFHKLAGSSGTFGFERLGHHARMLEHQLDSLVSGEPMDEVLRESLQEGIARLPALAGKNHSLETVFLGHQASVAPLALRPIYVVEDDAEQRDFIAATLRDQDYEYELFDSLDLLERRIAEQPPGAIIMDMAFPEGPTAGSELIARIKGESLLQVPVLFISVHNTIQSRLEAVRAGGDAYFAKPLQPRELIERLDYLVAKGKVDPYKVLIVDDDKALADYHASVLRSAELEVAVLTQPLEILDIMAEFKPELLLLDLNMPECNGVDLANLLRQHTAYDNLPIVFLSAESDVKRHFEARLVGADDFLVKPIDEQFLIAAVANRVQRARSAEQQMTRDSMTSLLNHEKLLDELDREMVLAEREGHELCYCMFDIDHFKRVNDTYGHVVGDVVIKQFAELLKRRLRRTDVVGRYGGEEFALVMPNTEPGEARTVCEELRLEFADFVHYAGLEEFSVTVSGGIALMSDYPDPRSLVEAADSALYLSKEGGRNRISMNTPASS